MGAAERDLLGGAGFLFPGPASNMGNDCSTSSRTPSLFRRWDSSYRRSSQKTATLIHVCRGVYAANIHGPSRRGRRSPIHRLVWGNLLRSRWRPCRSTDAAYPLRVKGGPVPSLQKKRLVSFQETKRLKTLCGTTLGCRPLAERGRSLPAVTGRCCNGHHTSTLTRVVFQQEAPR